jgi:aldehyde dehydrogenase (NAD+)
MIDLPCYVAGKARRTARKSEVRSPYSGAVVGTVPSLGRADVEEAVAAARKSGTALSRWERHAVLERARLLLEARREDFAHLITSESGLCLRETRYEVGRGSDVLRFAAHEALRDDGEVYSADVSPQGKSRKIFTLREPHAVVAAITPFNHPLNQVLHKAAPAIAAGAPLVLKPSEKTPLTALRCAELLYEAGLPPGLLSVVLGPTAEVAEVLVAHPDVEALTFTGSAEVGKRIASRAGYKKLCLELGGHSPLVVFDDADLDLAARLAAEGCFRNSGQRCTAVRRILVDEAVLDAFTERFVEMAREYRAGDPMDPEVRVGTVIDEDAARRLEVFAADAVAKGARVLLGGQRRGALFEPTVLAGVPRHAELASREAFGPLAPIFAVRGDEDAIALANATAFGLSAGVVTRSIERSLRAVKSLRTGTVNVNEVPGFRTECSPFGGVKDSGLGVKEGVTEAVRWMTVVKTFSLPW